MNDYGMKSIVSIALNNQHQMMLKIDYESIVDDPDLIQLLYLLIGTTEKAKNELVEFLSSIEEELSVEDDTDNIDDILGENFDG
ncbi:MAG: hypothetical protein ACOC33_02035 [bacterium]